MKASRRRLAASAAATAGLLLSACAQVHTGSEERGPGFDANAVQPSLLDTGNYPTKPRDPLGNAGSTSEGAVLEGHRLADFVVIPFQIDPNLTNPRVANSGVLDTPESVDEAVGFGSLAPIVAAHNFVTGVTAENNLVIRNLVLMFKTGADAAAAAAEMANAEKVQVTTTLTQVPVTPTAIPGHPNTTAGAWTENLAALNTSEAFMIAFTPHDRYVLVQVVDARRDTPQGGSVDPAALTGKTLDQQLSLIDGFTPTPADQLANLPKDPSGLRARMFAPSSDGRTADNGTYGPHGGLLFQPANPVAAQTISTETGVDLVISEDNYLIRTKDAASAQRNLDWEVTDRTKRGWTDIDGIPGLPSARCKRSGTASTQFWCAVTSDRLVLTSSSRNESDAKQKLAAGYLMLEAK